MLIILLLERFSGSRGVFGMVKGGIFSRKKPRWNFVPPRRFGA
jgi:hypothetical protein